MGEIEIFSYLLILVEYLPVTLAIFIGAMLVGSVIGVSFALSRVYKVPVLRWIVIGIVSYVRGVPVLVQLMLTYYFLPQALEAIGIPAGNWPAFAFVVAAYGIYAGVQFSEAIRGAIGSIPKGQMEAAYTIGMTGRQVLIRVIAPQALLIALPDVSNIMLIGLKSTSLAFTVGVMDMVGRGQALASQTLKSVQVSVALCIVYYIIAVLMEKGFKRLEQRLSVHLSRNQQKTQAEKSSKRQGFFGFVKS